MPFCPKCKYEYKPGIEICPDCDEKLVESLPEEEPDEEPELDGEIELALLCTTSSLVHTEFLKEALKDNDIPCLVKREGPSIYGSGVAGYAFFGSKIYIPKDKLEEAKRIKDQTIDNH
ncbi:MAG: DUF2007 domain-containing protein [candidate division Zixibacteria bacterium]|nr:DUF2007 domain-containing protein [candidate division Zixibacteria bacterium]